MKKETFSKGLTIFAACFKDFEVNKEKTQIWFRLLESMPDDVFMQAVSSLAGKLTNLYPGSNIVGLIQEEAANITGDGMSLETAAALAYDKVIKVFWDVGVYGSPKFDDPLIHAVIESLGGWVAFCKTPTDELKWWRKDFERKYQHMAPIKDRLQLPGHLPGVHELNNTQAYPDHVPDPVLVGGEEKKKPALPEGLDADGAEILRSQREINHV